MENNRENNTNLPKKQEGVENTTMVSLAELMRNSDGEEVLETKVESAQNEEKTTSEKMPENVSMDVPDEKKQQASVKDSSGLISMFRKKESSPDQAVTEEADLADTPSAVDWNEYAPSEDEAFVEDTHSPYADETAMPEVSEMDAKSASGINLLTKRKKKKRERTDDKQSADVVSNDDDLQDSEESDVNADVPASFAQKDVVAERAVKSSPEPGTVPYLCRMTLVLTIICVIIAALLAVVNAFTEDVIAENEEKKQSEAILSIFPEGDYVTPWQEEDALKIVSETVSGSLYYVFSEDEPIGFCAHVASAGYSDDIQMMVGINTDGTVRGIRIVDMAETSGVGSKAGSENFLAQFLEKTGVFSMGESIDGIAGATISSRAVTEGVNMALAVAGFVTVDENGKYTPVDPTAYPVISILPGYDETEETADVEIETTPPETMPPETMPPETMPPETTPPETMPPETMPPETTPPETMPPETTPPETMPPETTPPETTPPETMPPETTPPETMPPETTPPETGEEDGPVADWENETETETETETEHGPEADWDTETETETETKSPTPSRPPVRR